MIARLIGVVLVLLAGYNIYKGRVTVGDDHSTSFVTRAEKPVYFWLVIAAELILAAVLIVGLIHF